MGLQESKSFERNLQTLSNQAKYDGIIAHISFLCEFLKMVGQLVGEMSAMHHLKMIHGPISVNCLLIPFLVYRTTH